MKITFDKNKIYIDGIEGDLYSTTSRPLWNITTAFQQSPYLNNFQLRIHPPRILYTKTQNGYLEKFCRWNRNKEIIEINCRKQPLLERVKDYHKNHPNLEEELMGTALSFYKNCKLLSYKRITPFVGEPFFAEAEITSDYWPVVEPICEDLFFQITKEYIERYKRVIAIPVMHPQYLPKGSRDLKVLSFVRQDFNESNFINDYYIDFDIANGELEC